MRPRTCSIWHLAPFTKLLYVALRKNARFAAIRIKWMSSVDAIFRRCCSQRTLPPLKSGSRHCPCATCLYRSQRLRGLTSEVARPNPPEWCLADKLNHLRAERTS
jgi:hypothetical protein